MEKINFSIDINAPKEKVWNVLWNDDSYRKWTSPFAEGSYAKTDNWKEGSKVLFLGPGGDGGMVSKVATNKKNEFMSFEHLGVVKDGIEDTESDSVKGWAGARENYRLTDNNGKTKLAVDMDSTDEFKDIFFENLAGGFRKSKRVVRKKLSVQKLSTCKR
jgi:uncharacterized protein YndB with AHSA1/START domain